MRKTVSIGLGGRNFIMDEDAYILMNNYLEGYASTLKENRNEVMDEVEMRVADLLRNGMDGQEVVNCAMVKSVAQQMGLPENDASTGKRAPEEDTCSGEGTRTVHRFYRDTDDRKIGGVCGGMAAYFDVDVTLIRIIALVMLLCGGVGFWFYIICCIVAPSAYTAAEKCELRGIPCTAENLRRFTNTAR